MTTFHPGDRVRVKDWVVGSAGLVGFIQDIDDESETVFVECERSHHEVVYHPDQLELLNESHEVGGSRPGNPAVPASVAGSPDDHASGAGDPGDQPAAEEASAPAADLLASLLNAPAPAQSVLEELIGRAQGLGYNVSFVLAPRGVQRCYLESALSDGDDHVWGEGPSCTEALSRALNPEPPTEPEGGFDDIPF